MFGFFKKKKYRTPEGDVYKLFSDMAAQPHLLIAGATGSGKTVLENSIIYNLLHYGPGKVQFILIDPRLVELSCYKNIPHVISYASSELEILEALKYAERIVDSRYSEMEKRHIKEYDNSNLYIIIDELSDLMTTRKKDYLPILQHLAMKGRPARVHIIACTQTVKATVLPTELTCNFSSRVGLRTATALQSRMIIDAPGCEQLPNPSTEGRAQCYYRSGADLSLWNVPKYSKEQIASIIDWWTSDKCRV